MTWIAAFFPPPLSLLFFGVSARSHREEVVRRWAGGWISGVVEGSGVMGGQCRGREKLATSEPLEVAWC